jgi:hypothetical protein
MHTQFVAGILLSTAVLSLSAQGAETWVEITTDGRNRSRVAVVEIAPYSGAPSASVAAQPQTSAVPPTAKAFAIRGWQEAGSTRVVVYAVTVSDVNGKPVETMTQIATHLLALGQSAQVTETARYGSLPVTVTAVTK